LAIHPPGKVEQQLLEHAFEKRRVPLATRSRHLVYAPRRPRVHRRVHITKCKFIGGDLGRLVRRPIAPKKEEAVFRKMWIDFRKRDHVERQVPCGEPWVFPLIRHRDNIPVEKVRPLSISTEVSLRWRRWLCRITRQPFAN